jgi:hypothetical protein
MAWADANFEAKAATVSFNALIPVSMVMRRHLFRSALVEARELVLIEIVGEDCALHAAINRLANFLWEPPKDGEEKPEKSEGGFKLTTRKGRDDLHGRSHGGDSGDSGQAPGGGDEARRAASYLLEAPFHARGGRRGGV